jgi:thiamine biosynthesis protein ThiC
MTQLEAARTGIITQQMIEVAEDEGLSPEEIRAWSRPAKS